MGACSYSTYADPADDAAASRLIFAPAVRLLNPSFATPLHYRALPLGGPGAAEAGRAAAPRRGGSAAGGDGRGGGQRMMREGCLPPGAQYHTNL